MHKIPLPLQPTENDINHDTTQPVAATLPQPACTAEATSRHDEPCLDPRELQAVAGGPTIVNNSA